MFSLSIIGIVSLVAVSGAFGQVLLPAKPNIATIDVQDNFEYGTVTKSFRVHYPGICDLQLNEEVKLKIKSISGPTAELVHEFVVPVDDKATGKVYYFGLKNAKAGKYSVEVCVDGRCSDMSKSLNAILSDAEIPKLTCHMVTMESEGESDKKTWKITNNNAGPISVTTKPVTKLMTIKELNEQPQHLIWARRNLSSVCQKNPCYFGDEMYINYYYDLAHFKDLYVDPAEKEGTGSITVADQYCGRKYLLSTNVHLLDPETKEVKYRFKTTLNEEIPARIRNMYMFPPKEAVVGGPNLALGIPVERIYAEKIVEGKYELWVANCYTNKDKVDSSICPRPFVGEFIVGGTNGDATKKEL